MDVVIATDRWDGPSMLPDGTPVLNAFASASSARRAIASSAGRLLSHGWNAARFLERRRRERAEENVGECPSFAGPLSAAALLSRCVLSLRPRFVFGMEVFQHGMATALCKGVPRILMPWGGDIYLYPEASAVSSAMVRYALSRVDLVCPTSSSSVSHLVTRYGIPSRKIRVISWGVDRLLFRRATAPRRKEVLARFGVDPECDLFLNVRRFLPIWGCHIAMEAFRRYAKENPRAHFAMLGGTGTAELVREARKRLRAEGIEDRFLLFEGDTPFSDCVDLMSVAEAYVSLMLVPDMRSFSILQAAAAGGVPILSYQPEYREMERMGFCALFVDPRNPESVAETMRECVRNGRKAEEIRQNNETYIAKHEDQEVQMQQLRAAIEEVCRVYGR
jgi:glycosyltransferase involved in cell wall biosynthesis